MATVEVALRELETRVTWLEQTIRELRGDGRRPTPVSEEKIEVYRSGNGCLVTLQA